MRKWVGESSPTSEGHGRDARLLILTMGKQGPALPALGALGWHKGQSWLQ